MQTGQLYNNAERRSLSQSAMGGQRTKAGQTSGEGSITRGDNALAGSYGLWLYSGGNRAVGEGLNSAKPDTT